MQVNKTKNFFNAFKDFCKEKSTLLRCTECGSKIFLEKNMKFIRCCSKKCQKRKCFFKSDIFKGSRIDLEKIIKIIESLTTGCNNKSIRTLLDVSNATINNYKRKLKKLMKNYFKKFNSKIGGLNVIVEVDESKFGSRKYNRGRIIEGCWVLGLVERTPEKRIVLIKVKKRNEKTLTKKIKKYVHKGSIIYSDQWNGYTNLNKYGFSHLTVNHSKNYVDPHSGVHTQTIEGNWNGVKVGIPRKHRNAKGVGFYLLNYMFKRNYGVKYYDFLFNLF